MTLAAETRFFSKVHLLSEGLLGAYLKVQNVAEPMQLSLIVYVLRSLRLADRIASPPSAPKDYPLFHHNFHLPSSRKPSTSTQARRRPPLGL